MANLEGSLGVKECDRVWTCVCVGDVLSGMTSSSPTGFGTDMETEGRVALRGGEDEGETLPTVGNGCRPLYMLPGDVGLEGETALAVLSLRLRYSATRSWKDVLIGDGENNGGGALLKSSADLDHAFLEVSRRSPPPPEGRFVIGLEGVLGVWNLESSRDPGGLAERSRTELDKHKKKSVRTVNRAARRYTIHSPTRASGIRIQNRSRVCRTRNLMLSTPTTDHRLQFRRRRGDLGGGSASAEPF